MSKRARRAVFALLLLPALAAAPACGGKSPVEKCNDLITDTCARVPQCIPTSGLTEAACKQQVEALIPCSTAVDVASSYDSCISLLNSSSCAELFPNGALVLPSECMGVIQVK